VTLLYWLSFNLEQHWGPFRLLRSFAFLIGGGVTLSAILTLVFLPKLWKWLPHDHGKAILGSDGMKSAGKPTGAGFWVTLLALPVVRLHKTRLTFAQKTTPPLPEFCFRQRLFSLTLPL